MFLSERKGSTQWRFPKRTAIVVLALLLATLGKKLLAQMQLSPVQPSPRSAAWWTQRHSDILQKIKGQQFDLVFLGDSITQNYEKEGPAPDEVFAPVWREFYGKRKALNLGYSGDETQNLLWRIENGEVDGLSPKVAVILIGTNNSGLHPKWAPEENEAGIEAVVAELHKRCPQTKILLVGILPSAVSSQKSAIDNTVNHLLSGAYAKSSYVTFVDIAATFMKEGRLDEHLFYDTRLNPPRGALHPDTRAQRMMAEALEPTLVRLLGEAPVSK